jgi:hypothetical protein
MSFAVCRMAKMKSHDLKGIQFHNQRERESKTNVDINKELSKENYDLVNNGNINYNERVKQIIESQKIGTRKTRKDAVLVNEFVLTSDRSFFDGMDKSEQQRFFKESYKVFAERYGQQNIAYATVHLDEHTPHMHLGVVPMRDGKLQGKNIFNRQELLWLQEEYPKHLQGSGFDIERGEQGSDREHLETQKFKLQAVERDLAEVEKLLEKKDDEFEKLGAEFNKSLDIIKNTNEKVPYLKKETEIVRSGLMKSEERETGNYILSPEHMKDLAIKVNAAAKIQKDYERLKNTDFVKENRSIRSVAGKALKENDKLKKENSDLLKENNLLNKQVNHLKAEINLIYQGAKEFVKERTSGLQSFRDVFKDLMGKVKEKTSQAYEKLNIKPQASEFEKIYRHEQKRGSNDLEI